MVQGFLKVFGYGLCHQLPERSLFAGGLQLPVCARDTGIYVGFVVSLVLIAILSRGRRPSEMPSWKTLLVGGLFLSAMIADGVSSYAGLRSTTNEIRVLTGLLAGYALPLVAVPIVNSQLWRSASATRPLDSARGLWIWILSIPGAYLLTRYGLLYTGILYPWVIVVAVLVTFVCVNLVFVCFVPRFERAVDKLREAWLQVLLALALTIAQLAAAGLFRVFLEGIAF